MKPLLKRCCQALLVYSLVGTMFVGSTQAAEPPLPLDEYWQQVEETQALIASLEDAPTEAGRARLLATADQWERVSEVILADGTLVSVDHSFLISQLRADPPDLAQLNSLLATLLEARDTWPQTEWTSKDMDALDRILARPEFQWPSEQPSLLEEWWRWLLARFQDLLARLLLAGGILGTPLLHYTLTGLGALALILVLAYALRGLLADLVAEAELDAGVEESDEALTAAVALKRAQVLSSGGDYRAAVRYLYLSSLLLLEERGLLRYDRSLTNREYLRSLAHLPRLAATFRVVVEVFDRVWYGYQSLDEAAYARYAAQVGDLQQQT